MAAMIAWSCVPHSYCIAMTLTKRFAVIFPAQLRRLRQKCAAL